MSTHEDVVTTDISDFGYRELAMAAELLTALTKGNGRPDDFEFDGIKLAMNRNSGYVFLTNEEYEVAMMNGDKLESWYSCLECGHEGFKEDMPHGDDNSKCQRYLRDIGVLDAEDEEETADAE